MKVLLIPRDWFSELHLEPQNDRDRTVLEALVADYEVQGMGRHAETSEIMHVQVMVTRQNSGDAPQCFADPSEY